MKNKVIVELLVPELEHSYSTYLPISKRIGDIIHLLVKAVSDFNDIDLGDVKKKALYNVDTGLIYSPNDLLINTDIRNGTRLVLI